MSSQDYTELLKKASARIKDYQQQIAELKTKNSAVAVVGLSCKFPDAENVEQFWQNCLDAKVSLSSIVDAKRWPHHLFSERIYTPNAGFIKDIDLFDEEPFHVSPEKH